MSELVVLVNARGEPIGSSEKFAAHHGSTPLHLAFSCYVFNDKGQLLVTRRALGKKVWPGVWTNSVCGHPAPDEDMIAAIERRLLYELGMTARYIKLAVADYTYKTPPFKGVVEHEYCPIYFARASSKPHPNFVEVDGYKWLSWPRFIKACASDRANSYSWWCKDQIKRLDNLPLIMNYSKAK